MTTDALDGSRGVTELISLIADVLKVDPASVDLETGPRNHPRWDSLNHVLLMVAIEETYKLQLSPDEVVSLLSVGEIARALREKGVKID